MGRPKARKIGTVYTRDGIRELFPNVQFQDAALARSKPVAQLLNCLHNRARVPLTESVCAQTSNYFFPNGDVEVAVGPSTQPGKNQARTLSARVPRFCARGGSSDVVLNVGFPVWSLAFSPPFSWGEGAPEGKGAAIILAVSGVPTNAPLWISSAPPPTNPVTIQLWTLCPTLEDGADLWTTITHPTGGYCRCLKWVPHSGTPTHVGFLFAAFGNGSIIGYSVPIRGRVCVLWSIEPTWASQCVAPAPYFVVSELSTDAPAVLRIATGTVDGRVLIWDWDGTGDAPPSSPCTIIRASDDAAAITALSWALFEPLGFLAVSTISGAISVWDVRRPLSGKLYELDISRRASYDVCWSLLPQFICACHVTACIFNVLTRECSQRAPARNKAAHTRSPVQERSPWSCCTIGIMAAFAFDQGHFLVQPLNKLDRDPQKSSWVFVWDALHEEEEPDGCPSADLPAMTPPACPPVPKKHQQDGHSTVTPDVLTRFHQSITSLYAAGMQGVRRRGLRIRMALDTKLCTKEHQEKSRYASADDALPTKGDTTQLHAVASFDPVFYDCAAEPFYKTPLLATGGAAGVVHVLNLAGWDLNV